MCQINVDYISLSGGAMLEWTPQAADLNHFRVVGTTLPLTLHCPNSGDETTEVLLSAKRPISMSTVAPVRGLTELASLGSKRWQQTKSDLQIGGIAEGDTVELQNLDEKIKSLLSREEEAHEPLLAMEPITAQRRGSQ